MSQSKVAPTVGRVVHYYAEGGPGAAFSGPIAATVTAVYTEPEAVAGSVVDLATMMPGREMIKPKARVPFSEKPTKHCWTWPPKI